MNLPEPEVEAAQARTEVLAEHWRVFRLHPAVGADGECPTCETVWPCCEIRRVLDLLLDEAERNGRKAAGAQALRDAADAARAREVVMHGSADRYDWANWLELRAMEVRAGVIGLGYWPPPGRAGEAGGGHGG